MISGTVRADRRAIVRLALVGIAGQVEEIEAVIDTGFNGYLTLPSTVTTLLGLTYHHEERAILADGQGVPLPVYVARVLWDGVVQEFLALETGDDALIGMALFEGYRLTIDAIDGGPVTIEPIS